MSKTQLQTNNARLSQLITELQGKAAGGGASLETCTVTVKGCRAVYYTGVENGEIVAKSSTGTSNSANHNIVVCKNSMVVCALLASGNSTITGGNLIASYINSYSACEITADNAIISNTSMNSGGAID